MKKNLPSGMKAIPLQQPIDDFNTFLNSENNSRIIFSGVFGIGKTYFLQEYFNSQEKFIPIHISPTNYSVAKNEDIFELIKYDIFYELLKKNIYLEKNKISTIEAIQFIKAEDVYNIFKVFLKAIPDIGKKTVEILEPLEKLIKVIEQAKSSQNNDEGNKIRSFAQKFEEYGIYENDIYTQLIIDLLNREREVHATPNKNEDNEKLKKEVVLIVDDLDRIDPEHIFRILNVFAAHFDWRDGKDNKFGFDKVIVVCDINNVKNIFSNRYGRDVDFNGYINKFYSTNVYNFANSEAFNEFIKDIVNSFHYSDTRDRNSFAAMDKILEYILTAMINSGVLSLRVLINHYNEKFNTNTFKLELGSYDVEMIKFPFLRV